MQLLLSLRLLLPLSIAATLTLGCSASRQAGSTTQTTSTTTTEVKLATLDPPSPCPPNSMVSYARANTEPFTSGYKLDLGSITRVVAVRTKEGRDLRVVFMNGDFDAKRIAEGMQTPINETQTGKFAVVVTFTNADNPVVPGTYTPLARINQPLAVTAEIQVPRGAAGTACLVSATGGDAKILEMSNGKVCGTIGLSGESAGVSGSFVADIIE